jgi:hypothetical protein
MTYTTAYPIIAHPRGPGPFIDILHRSKHRPVAMSKTMSDTLSPGINAPLINPEVSGTKARRVRSRTVAAFVAGVVLFLDGVVLLVARVMLGFMASARNSARPRL